MKLRDVILRALVLVLVFSTSVLWVTGQSRYEQASSRADLVEAVASFGAVAHSGALYVYGGHLGPVHDFSTDTVSTHFRRLPLGGPGTWEEATTGPALQGAILVSHGPHIIRVGGMATTNAPGERSRLHSTDAVARYVPTTEAWEPLPPMPAGRSSHDAVVAGDTLYVAGGWELMGSSRDATWAESVLALDLRGGSDWREIPAPFRRRALAAAIGGGRLYVIGGMTEERMPVRRVDVLDLQTEEWSHGPELPEGGQLQGFGPAAVGVGEEIYVSLPDGVIYRLDDQLAAWEPVTRLAQPRYMHRLVRTDDGLLAVGGVGESGYLTSIEMFTRIAR